MILVSFFRMAQDEQLIETDHASRTGGASKALGVLAAVSAGGLMALRMKPAPFMFLAGAAAVALLGRKRVIPSSRPLELMPERSPEPAEPPRVEIDAWLARQIEREQQAPVITLDVESLPETTPPAPEPLETAKAALEPPVQTPAASRPFFAESPAVPPTMETAPSSLLESSVPELVPPVSLWDAPLASPTAPEETPLDGTGFLLPSEPDETSPIPSQELYPPSPAGRTGASWLLGIEPLPSWDELASDHIPSPSKPSADFAFLSEPPGAASYTPQPAPGPTPAPAVPAAPEQPLFIPALFQGGALPDEITVAEEPPSAPLAEKTPDLPSEPLSEPLPTTVAAVQADNDGQAPMPWPFSSPGEPPAAHPQPASAPLADPVPSLWTPADLPTAPVETPPAAEASQAEWIPVSLASPGEASFDDPLAALEENPSSLPGGLPPPPPLRPLAPVVEAEIIVRPRGAGPSRIQPKNLPESQEAIAPPLPSSPELTEVPTPPVAPQDESHPEAAATPVPPAAPHSIPPAPVVLPREQKARKTWRSWWRGD